ncbi:hypothetical protein Psta_2392 [Pirellula staleyi DSM 6068]|uniref:FeoB-associated Cys-rich membrane protein n=1 Tax=Pirellula staleyi (strain ATCC 27377 / DSM 6068 / ICPB 4128) TaxID=530564 RepID=D2R4J6_PIRSD|nr:FeoB-associated Cys-rich membrane protein [Pirellula staleyi]ADB17062.1 hypothetical protein Psta_2392 [Pirellula staleyi DSM 6068]
MPTIDTQMAIVIGLVAGAALYLGLQVFLTLRGNAKKGCSSGCGSCPSNQSGSNPGGSTGSPLVQISMPDQLREKR